MNLKSIYSLIVLFLLAYSAFASGQINYADTYLEARQRAIEEDKPYIIIFESDECQPCSWMQEQTLQDKKLQQLINKEYIAVKVDIDDFDGYALKKYYKINKLPSILLFSPKGAEQQRIEHALTASEFIQLLNDPESELSVEITSPARKESTVERPDKPKPSKQPTESEYYSVQLGVFSSGQNASKLVDRVKRISSKEVFIRQEGGLFKVFSGSLEEESEAQAHLNMLKDYGYDGFIKSMLMTSKL
jgi:thioredoxin-related protein